MPKKRWRDLVDKGVKVLSDAADVAIHLRSAPGPLGAVAIGSRILNAVNEVTATDPSTFFNGWTHLRGVYPLGDFAHALCKQAQLLVDEKPSGTGSNPRRTGNVVTATLYDQRIGWVEHDNWKEGPFCDPSTDPDRAVGALRVLIWTAMGNAVKYYDPPLGSPVLVSDSIDETLTSKTADDLWAKHRQFVEHGHKRSVLVFGEPGVGKSHIIRRMGDLAGGHRLRIRARDLESLRSLGHLIRFLQPSAVLIDDLDRAKNADGILEEFDEIRATASLFLVTANHVGKLDPATVRRFDDWHHIERLDDAVLSRMLDGVAPAIVDQLKKLPVTYIARYREAHDSLGSEAAAHELKSLIDRRETVLRLMEAAETNEPTDQPEKA